MVVAAMAVVMAVPVAVVLPMDAVLAMGVAIALVVLALAVYVVAALVMAVAMDAAMVAMAVASYDHSTQRWANTTQLRSASTYLLWTTVFDRGITEVAPTARWRCTVHIRFIISWQADGTDKDVYLITQALPMTMLNMHESTIKKAQYTQQSDNRHQPSQHRHAIN